ncbi:MAG TPA: hypothetical protein VIG25_12880 [Pyrinomonadaceae bacterium]|jgi:hypothetical protein
MQIVRAGPLLIVIAVTAMMSQDHPRLIGSIDFYGYAGLNVDQIRSGIPVQVGDPFPGPAEIVNGISKAVKSSIGRPPTDVAPVCCDPQGNYMIYVGLPGASIKPTKLNPVPKAKLHFPTEIVELYEQTMEASGAAVLRGTARADTSQGYSLSTSDPALRAKQLEVRAYAIEHEKLIRDMLNSSSDAQQRIVAAFMLEYTRPSNQQISSLVHASHDFDETVRNNATRALGVLAGSSPKVAARIPADGFITMLSSVSWTDRNKAGWVLISLTRSRDAKLLGQLRSDALISLIEMARWRNAGHAYNARILLGRIAGIPEERLEQLANADNADEIINALRLNERKNH